MTENNSWRFRKEVNLSAVLQLCLMVSLILGSWLNLQRRIDTLQHDVDALLKGQERFSDKAEVLSAQCVRYEYRLELLERLMNKEKKL